MSLDQTINYLAEAEKVSVTAAKKVLAELVAEVAARGMSVNSKLGDVTVALNSLNNRLEPTEWEAIATALNYSIQDTVNFIENTDSK